MATRRQLPNNTDIAPFQERGRWYHAFIEKDESGNAKLTYKDEGLPEIEPTGYGFTMDGQKDGKNFHLVSVSSNPGIGSGTPGEPAFYYPTIGINYTDADSQYVVDFNKPETNVSLKINDTAAAVSQTVNGLVQKNIELSASVGSGLAFDKEYGYFPSRDDTLEEQAQKISEAFKTYWVDRLTELPKYIFLTLSVGDTDCVLYGNSGLITSDFYPLGYPIALIASAIVTSDTSFTIKKFYASISINFLASSPTVSVLYPFFEIINYSKKSINSSSTLNGDSYDITREYRKPSGIDNEGHNQPFSIKVFY